jgi:hypothetical protein
MVMEAQASAFGLCFSLVGWQQGSARRVEFGLRLYRAGFGGDLFLA